MFILSLENMLYAGKLGLNSASLLDGINHIELMSTAQLYTLSTIQTENSKYK